MDLLIVNDEVLTADTLMRDMDWQALGIDFVRTAYSAREARAAIEEQRPDILLCDIEMPEESGIDLVQWLRKEGIDAECIFLTCHANFDYAKEAVKLGCRDYVLMPADYGEIACAMRRVIERLTVRRRSEQMEQYGKLWLDQKREQIREESGEKKSPAQLVQECRQYILQHLGEEELCVNHIADHFHMSPIYMNRLYKKESKTSIGQTIIRERMNMAAELLAKSGLTAASVAAQVGYPNYSYFSTAFKKHFGCSPQQYKGQKSPDS